RVDYYFVCESLSTDDYYRDAKHPSNYIILETRASHDIIYDLTGVFLGSAYGTIEKPKCGEPELPFGTKMRTISEHRDYSIECLDSLLYVSPSNADLPDTSIHKQRCGPDQHWHGSFPQCLPPTTCPLPVQQTDQSANQSVLID